MFFVFAFAGLFHALFVQFTHVYPFVTVASILTCCPYLYVTALVVFVHPLLTALIHVHLLNVNVTGFENIPLVIKYAIKLNLGEVYKLFFFCNFL